MSADDPVSKPRGLTQVFGPDDDPGIKRYRAGTHRSREPEETLQRLAPDLQAMGITRVADITGLDRIGIPVAMVVRPNSRSLAVSQGKGLSLVSAQVSGIMESVETFHAERITRPLKLTDRSTLAEDARVVDTDSMPKSGEREFRNDVRTLWIEGVDLVSGERTWVPYEAVHTDFTLPRPDGSGYFPADTNGLASGNCDVEAIAHALYELVERDALALWRHRGPGDRRVVDLDSIDDSDAVMLIDRLRTLDLHVRVWDVASDIGIPCFHCLIMGDESLHADADPEFGSGCHPDKRVALLRAITEAVQARTTFIAGSRDDFEPEAYASQARERRRQSCAALLQEAAMSVSFDSLAEQVFDTVLSDLERTIRALKGRGIEEVIWVDLARADLGIPVARVIVPGLEGAVDSSDYVPGRRALSADAS